MNLPLLTKLTHLIEEILKDEIPVVEEQVASNAMETAENDPKVQGVAIAAAALLAAAQDLRAAANAPPQGTK